MALRQNIALVLLLLLCLVRSEINQDENDGASSETANLRNYFNPTIKNMDYDIFAGAGSSSNDKECPYTQCNKLSASCMDCDFNESCVYGSVIRVTCHSKVNCKGERTFVKSMKCRYCYQTDHWEHSCVQIANCSSAASPKAHYRTNCTVKNDILCFGRRTFLKNVPCNWTGGYRWSTALILSITLGGFGADRFYLGQWQEGIGKLFSFGGLGVWTLIDVILIAIRYLGPADGSLYL